MNSFGSQFNNDFEEPYVGMPIANMNRSVQKKESYCEAVNSCALAMAYVPWQCWQQTYEPNVALQQGTIFPELDLPWEGWRY